MQGLRTKDKVDEGGSCLYRLALLARDTATHTYLQIRISLFEFFPTPQLMKHLFLRLLSNRAGVEQQ